MIDLREQQEQFYEQFNTVIEQHRAWCHTPEGTVEILRDPWKARSPEVRIHVVTEPNVGDILWRIQQARLNLAGGVSRSQTAQNAASQALGSQSAANFAGQMAADTATEDLIRQSFRNSI